MANDHYVSRFYLKRFGFPNKGNPRKHDIFTYNTKDRLFKQRGIQNIACKANLFHADIEKGFSEVEDTFNRLIKKIETNMVTIIKSGKILSPLTYDDKFFLAKFMEFQFRRSCIMHPSIITGIENNNQEIINHVKEKGYPISLDDFGKVLSSPISGTYNATVNYVARRFFTGYSENNGPGMVDILLQRDWVIYYIESSKPAEFITSDFPVYRLNPKGGGIGLKDSETIMIFPLSPKILLVNMIQFRDQSIKYCAINDRSVIRMVNRMITSNSIEMIFGKNQKLLESLGQYHASEHSIKYAPTMPSSWNGNITQIKQDIDILLTKYFNVKNNQN